MSALASHALAACSPGTLWWCDYIFSDHGPGPAFTCGLPLVLILAVFVLNLTRDRSDHS